MKNNNLILAGAIAGTLSACSSPPKLTEPSGEWISFEQPTSQVGSFPQSYSYPVSQQPSHIDLTPKGNETFIAHKQSDIAIRNKVDLVTGDGKNIPLTSAVRRIVPSTWSVQVSPDVVNRNVSWVGNDQWPYVLRKMLSHYGMEASINDRDGKVIVNKSIERTAVKTPALATSLAVGKTPTVAVETKPASMNTQVQGKTPTVAVEKKPASMNTQVQGKTPTVVVEKKPASALPAAEGKTIAPVVTPTVLTGGLLIKTSTSKDAKQVDRVSGEIASKALPPAPLVKSWRIEKGTSLKKGYEGWVSKEICGGGKNNKWDVQWNTDVDYPVDYPLSFSSTSFEDATSQLFNLYRKAQAPLYVSGYRNQCLIIISDRK